jgi:hypothetical protein
MRFHLGPMLIVVALFSVLCGLIFTLPAMISLPLFTALLWVSPGTWVIGIVYGRGTQQAFCIGALMSGLAPYVLVGRYSVNACSELIERSVHGNHVGNQTWFILMDGESAPGSCLFLLAPAIVSLMGGGVALAMRRFILPREVPAFGPVRSQPPLDEARFVDTRPLAS